MWGSQNALVYDSFVPKRRADVLLVELGLAESREQAQRLILAGKVRHGTLVLVKPAQELDVAAELTVVESERYVSRGGLKLEGALREFGVDPTSRWCLDVGASTGGFTDCLLQHGAAGVVAVDVGKGQLHQRLREDARVVVVEGVNARALPGLSIDDWRRTPGRTAAVVSGDLTSNDELRTTVEGDDGASNQRPSTIDDRQSSVSLFVADLSFISLRLVLPSVASRVAAGTEGVVLLKPQFEAGRKDVPRGGVIKDERVVERVRAEFVSWLEGSGWHVYGMMRSPIRGGDGNVELLVHIRTPGFNAETQRTQS